MKKAQQIARLSRRCFAEVEKMAADPGRYCKSKKITSYTFQFLNTPSLRKTHMKFCGELLAARVS